MPTLSKTTTTFKHLDGLGTLGAILIRLMMFVNDITLCNDALEQWHKYEDESRKKRLAGAKMYFIRLMISHIHEALKVINKINAVSELRNAVGQCDEKTQALFDSVVRIVGTEEAKRMKRIRDAITFHYLHDKIEPAIASLAKKFPDNERPVSIGDHTIDWHFEPADRVIDNAVLKQIFGVPDDADLNVEIKKIIEEIQSFGDDLALFAGQFIFFHANRT